MILIKDYNAEYLIEDLNIKNAIKRIKAEIAEVIINAKINKSFDKDVKLSFGVIHINPYGSISEISFNGIDVTNIDRFVVEQAIHIKRENFEDIREYVYTHASEFAFYPISDGEYIRFTILKYCDLFYKKFGKIIEDHERFKIQYTLKYLIISVLYEQWEIYCFEIESFDEEHLQNLLITDAIRQVGLNKKLYYCFSNKPEILLRIGQIKHDFRAFKSMGIANMCSFYKGFVSNLIIKLYKKNQKDNGKPLVNDTRRLILRFLIDATFGGLKHFCELKNIDEKSVQKYISGETNSLKYKNQDEIVPTRIDEILNLPLQIEAKNLKNSLLLEKIQYDDIPEVYDDFD